LERYTKEGLGRECGIGSRKLEKDYRKADPCLKAKYELKMIMMMMMIIFMGSKSIKQYSFSNHMYVN